MGIRKWELAETDPEQAMSLSRGTGLPGLLCRVLCARGYTAGGAVEDFLSEEGRLFDPYLLQDMDKAVRRIRLALEFGEQIAVYGDYDCDGITATALLVSYLQSLGARVFYYIPDREREGYGLNKGAVDALSQMEAQLIITVDNGISAHEEIAYAASLGIDVVVTDHHTPRGTMPEAAAVVNPRRADCAYPFKELAGVGVAFKLVCALEEAEGGELLEYYAELVALGTIADVVPLTGENRVIAACGLRQMEETHSPGLGALLEVSGLSGKRLGGEAAAFGLIPRLNACGRMGCVDDALELLLTDDPRYAAELAEKLDALNRWRRKIEDEILSEIDELLQKNPRILQERVILLGGRGWHHGVVGIVAAKLMERYEKPCILFSIEEEEARGSGRSMKGFSLIEAVTACARHLTRYGGHTLAAGLTLPADSLEAFCRDLLAFARENCEGMPAPVLPVDCALSPGELTAEAVQSLSLLEPLGEGNRAPLFLFGGLLIEGIYPTADKKHIRLRLAGEGGSFYAVYFRMSEQDFPYRAGDTVDLVAGVGADEYNGKAQVSVKIRDLRLANVCEEEVFRGKDAYSRCRRGEALSGGAAEGLVPARDDFAAVYRYLRKNGVYRFDEVELYYRLRDAVHDFGRLLVCLDVLEELGLLRRGGDGIQVIEGAARADMKDSRILAGLQGNPAAGI